MARRARRSFTPAFKAQVVLELLSGHSSHAELCRTHQLSASLLTLWKDTFHERLPLVFDADPQRSADQQRVADLEQLVGRQALELEILKKASRLLNGHSAPSGRSS